MLKVSALPKTPLTVKVINSACSVQKPVLSVQLDLNIYLDAPRATTLSDFLVPFFFIVDGKHQKEHELHSKQLQ